MLAHEAWASTVEALAPRCKWDDLTGVPYGWRVIVEDFARAVHVMGVPLVVMQIKEKCGGLRISYGMTREPHGCHPKIDALVDAACDRADVTCEECGKVGMVGVYRGWARVLCPEHVSRYLPHEPDEGRG